MLNHLKIYSQSKSLTVNPQKSTIVCFNSRSCNLPTFFYDNQSLPYSDNFKYLGMFCDKSINLNKAAEEALKPCKAGMARARTFLRQYHLTHRLHANMWLFKTYIVPAGMHACQIWATSYLRQGSEMDNCIQKWLLRYLKYTLGVRTSTPSWSVLRECGVEPIQLNWFRACGRFYNTLTHSNSALLHRVFLSDIALSQVNPSCWTSHLLLGTNGLYHAATFQHLIRSGQPLNLSLLVTDLRARHLSFWRQSFFSDFQPRDCNSKKCTYHHWCALPLKNPHVTFSPLTLPKYFYLDLPKHVIWSVAQFRLRVHHLKVEQSYWSTGTSPTCHLCNSRDAIQDEQHVLFKCTHPEVCNLRLKYASLFAGPPFSFSSLAFHVAPYLPAFHHVTSHDMSHFLNQNNNKLYPFLHELLLFYDQASSQSF